MKEKIDRFEYAKDRKFDYSIYKKAIKLKTSIKQQLPLIKLDR